MCHTSVCPQDCSTLRNHIYILAGMQHYGLSTRLLDVASNALTALYFTCEFGSSRTGEVVALEKLEPEICTEKQYFSMKRLLPEVLEYYQLKSIILVIKKKEEMMRQLKTYRIDKMKIYPGIDRDSEYIKSQVLEE